MKTTFFYPILKYLAWYVLLLITSVFIGYVLQHVPFIISFDNYFYVLINGLPHTSLIAKLIYPIDLWFFPLHAIFFMPAFFYFLYAAFFIPLFIFKRSDFLYAITALIIGLVLAGIILKVDLTFIFRIRPFDVLPNQVSMGIKNTLHHITSYPSGHTRDTVLSATIISKFFPKVTWFMIIFTLIIAFTRVYTGEHYPTDVITGAIYGYIIGLLALKITGLWYKHGKS